jgi:hypothetical protein
MKMSEVFWWLQHDWMTYKTPVSEGKVLIPQEFLEPGFELDPTELWYSYQHGRKDNRKIADFAAGPMPWFFVNLKAYEAFKDMFLRHGRSYPVRCSNEPHYIVLIDTVLEAIDLGRSKFERLDLHDRPEDDIARMLRVVLKDSFQTDADIFRLGGSYQLGLETIVSSRFKDRYEQTGLTGLIFWPTDGSDGEKN